MNMRTYLLYLSLLTIGFSSCAPPDDKSELENLKQQRNELNDRIAALEEKIAKNSGAESGMEGKWIETMDLKKETFKTYVEVQGRVDADENLTLASETGGQIMRITVKPGQEVSKGQLLLETDNKVILQGIEEMKSALSMANTLYEKQKNLWDQKIGTELQFLQAKNQKEGLEKKLATLNEQLKMTQVTSPINGTIDGVHVKLGQVIAPGMPAITVVNFSNLKVKAEVPESFAPYIRPGADAKVSFPDMNDSVSATVSHAGRVIDPLNRTFSVEVNLSNKKIYHPNMITVLKINDYQSKEPVITIPVKYVQRGEDGKEYVMVAESGTARKKEVALGKKYNGMVEIIQGLQAGEKIITRGFSDVVDGEKVQIIKS
jgi:membrane fusion protein, multidrug efflux system